MKGVKHMFVDTNVLIIATNELSPWHNAATKSLQDAQQNKVELIISQQILREYLAAATRISAIENGLPLSDILENVSIFRSDYTIVEDNPFVLDCLIELMQEANVGGKQVHDANIVATMQAHNITHLLTQNTGDFQRFDEFIAVIPLEP